MGSVPMDLKMLLCQPYPEPPRNRTLTEGATAMEVHFPPELESKLTHSAAQQSRNPDELVQDVVSRYIEEGERVVEAVERDDEALQQGEYLTREQRSNP
jgi:hypothetical protein